MNWVIKNDGQLAYGPCLWDADVLSTQLAILGYSVSFPVKESTTNILIRGLVSVETTTDPVPDPIDYMDKMRTYRDCLINRFYWRVERHESQDAGGITPTDNDTKMAEIYTYLQALRDMPEVHPDVHTKAEYDALVWPTEPT
jgi:hypothetical protein